MRSLRSTMPTNSNSYGVKPQTDSMLTDTSPDLLADVLLTSVKPDVDNERDDSNEDLSELMASMQSLGLQERVKLYNLNSGAFLIASGHRRVAAARALGWSSIPAIITCTREGRTQQTISRIASNICRKDIDPISLGRSISSLFNEHNITIAEAAMWLGKPPAYVNNHLRLLELPNEVQEWLRTNMLSVGHALQLLRIKGPQLDGLGNILASADECRIRLARSTIEENLSIRSLEVRVKNVLDNNRATQVWLTKQHENGRTDMPIVTDPAGPLPSATAAVQSTPLGVEDRLRAQRSLAKQAIQAEISFDELSGPSLDHLRLAALMLADNIYFYHNIVSTELPDHGSLNRTIERVQDVSAILNLIGRLVNAALISDLNIDGTGLVGNGRSKWASSRFRLVPAIQKALQDANLDDEISF